ncbi:MAG: hypothetical protein ABGY75_11585 [Gemmataceae bacterium]
MLTTVLRLTFAVLWAGFAAVLLLRNHLLPPAALVGRDPAFLDAGGYLAALLAVYNVVRWWLGFRRRRKRMTPVNPLARPPRAQPPEYHQELDFIKPEPK